MKCTKRQNFTDKYYGKNIKILLKIAVNLECPRGDSQFHTGTKIQKF